MCTFSVLSHISVLFWKCVYYCVCEQLVKKWIKRGRKHRLDSPPIFSRSLSLHSFLPSLDDSRSSQIIAPLSGNFSLLPTPPFLLLLPFMCPLSFRYFSFSDPPSLNPSLNPQATEQPSAKREKGMRREEGGRKGERVVREIEAWLLVKMVRAATGKCRPAEMSAPSAKVLHSELAQSLHHQVKVTSAGPFVFTHQAHKKSVKIDDGSKDCMNLYFYHQYHQFSHFFFVNHELYSYLLTTNTQSTY